MILIGIGANLPHEKFGSALDTCRHALGKLADHPEINLIDKSRWYESAPVPASDQPWFINGVVSIETGLSTVDLMNLLHEIEEDCGRKRGAGKNGEKGPKKNAPRVLDLDLLDFNATVSGEKKGDGPNLPHPRMEARAFVLLPLADIAPHWHHPVTGKSLDELIKELNPDQVARPLTPK